jgi:hypothetical protein
VRSRNLIWLMLSGLVACGETKPVVTDTANPDDTGVEPACDPDDPWIEVGTGSAQFESLADGDPVTMVHGPQGGWHMLGSVRVHNMTTIVEIAFTVKVEASGVQVGGGSLYVQLVAEDECVGYFPGMYAYLNVTELVDGDRDTPPELLAYEPVVMDAVVTGQDGTVASGEVRVIATPDPSDLADERSAPLPTAARHAATPHLLR